MKLIAKVLQTIENQTQGWPFGQKRLLLRFKCKSSYMKIGSIDLGTYPLLLAPMEDVTDPAFRLMCKRFGADMVYTEFISADALIRNVKRTEQKLIIYTDD